MLRGMAAIPSNHPLRSNELLNNSFNENVLLHTRNLCDFCTSKNPNDIKPSDLFDNYDTAPEYRVLRQLMRRICKKYGKSGKGSARWAFNKKLAHPTKQRGLSFNYTRYLDRVHPILQDIVAEIGRLERLRGRTFP